MLSNAEQKAKSAFNRFLQQYYVGSPRESELVPQIPRGIKHKEDYFLEEIIKLPSPDDPSETITLNLLRNWILRFTSYLLIVSRNKIQTVENYVINLLNYWTVAGLGFDRKFLLKAKTDRITFHRRISNDNKELSLLDEQLPRDLSGKPPCMWFDLARIFDNMGEYGYDRVYMCAVTSLAFCTALRASSAATLTYNSIRRILLHRSDPDLLYITFSLNFLKGSPSPTAPLTY